MLSSVIHPYWGPWMYQEIYPYRAMSIDSIKINASLIMIGTWKVPDEVTFKRPPKYQYTLYDLLCTHILQSLPQSYLKPETPLQKQEEPNVARFY